MYGMEHTLCGEVVFAGDVEVRADSRKTDRALCYAWIYEFAMDRQDTRAIQHYLGHRSIASTVRYTALAPDRFKGFWKDVARSTALPCTERSASDLAGRRRRHQPRRP